MKPLRILPLAMLLVLLVACVTINIYFPAAQAQDAAEKIVDDIIGDKAKAKPQPPASHEPQSSLYHPVKASYAFNLFDLLISPAEASQTKFSADTPAVRRLQAQMKQRFGQLRGFYQNGAIGFTRDALVAIHKLSAAPLKQRGQLKNLLKAENRDRNQLYREIARANGHPEWEKDVRKVFAKAWVDKAAKGWWYQNAQGGWVQK